MCLSILLVGRDVQQWCAEWVAWSKKHTYKMTTNDEDELSNLKANTKSVALMELSRSLWPDHCPEVGPSGHHVEDDVKAATQAALPLMLQVLTAEEKVELKRHLENKPCRYGCHLLSLYLSLYLSLLSLYLSLLSLYL